jgi:CRP/FNR family cyclic AMP-dependent transcriptional regulator
MIAGRSRAAEPAAESATSALRHTRGMDLKNPHLWIEALGYVGAALTISTYSMRTMVPLRISGIVANIVFVGYGALAHVYPTLLLHLVLLPLNVVRLRQLLQLVRSVKQAARGDLSLDWLRPYSRRRSVAAGELLWRRGDAASEMLFVLSGRLRVVEPGIEAGPGEVLGEIGLITPGNTRTHSLQCTEPAELLVIGYDELRQLYFQNPHFGFWFMQLASQRLLRDADITLVRPAPPPAPEPAR